MIGAQLAEPRKEDAKVMALTDAGADRQPADATPAIVATPLPPPTAAPASGQGSGM